MDEKLTYPRILEMPYSRLEGDDCLYWITSREGDCSGECMERGCQHMARKALKSVVQAAVECKDGL